MTFYMAIMLFLKNQFNLYLPVLWDIFSIGFAICIGKRIDMGLDITPWSE